MACSGVSDLDAGDNPAARSMQSVLEQFGVSLDPQDARRIRGRDCARIFPRRQLGFSICQKIATCWRWIFFPILLKIQIGRFWELLEMLLHIV